MADSEFGVKVEGLDELIKTLRSLPEKLRQQALRNVLAAGARVVRDESKRLAPVLDPESAIRNPYRKPGTVRDAIRVRTSKEARRAGDVGVFVNVRPAKRGQRSAKSKDDPYYWRWLEFGRDERPAGTVRARGVLRRSRARRARRAVGAIAPMRFLQAGAQKLGEALRVIEQRLGPVIQRMNVRHGGKP